MGFLNKLGNAAGDFASFAVPAGLTLGATALTGGAINPANAGGVMSLLGALGAGAKGFAGNEEEERARKMMLQQNKNQAMSNLINSLSPRANNRAQQAAVPSPGFLEQGARGVGMGVDAIRMADKAKNAAEDRASRLAYEKAQTDRLTGLSSPAGKATERSKALMGQFDKQDDVSKQVVDAARYSPQLLGQTPVQMMESSSNNPNPDAPTRLFNRPLEELVMQTGVDGKPEGIDPVRGTAIAKGTALRMAEINKAKAAQDELEAAQKASGDALVLSSAKSRDDFRGTTQKTVEEIPAVERLRAVESQAGSLAQQIDDMKSGKVPFEGVTGLTMAKSFIRIYDDAQVTEGDIATIRNQAQSAFQTAKLAISRFVNSDNPAVFDPSILDDMSKAIVSLQEASQAQASRVVGNYFDALEQQGLETIPQSLINESRTSSFRMLGIEPPSAPAQNPSGGGASFSDADADKANAVMALLNASNGAGATGSWNTGGATGNWGSKPNEAGILAGISQGLKFPPVGLGELPSVPLFSMDGATRQRMADRLRRYGTPEDEMKTMTQQELNRLLGL